MEGIGKEGQLEPIRLSGEVLLLVDWVLDLARSSDSKERTSNDGVFAEAVLGDPSGESSMIAESNQEGDVF